jgi:hypothetical protein
MQQANNEIMPILIGRAIERSRQERETFEQHKKQENNWFVLRLVMGYSAVILLGVIMFVSSYILLNSSCFPGKVVTAASGALFIDVLGLLVGVWKIALNPNFVTKLQPTTNDQLPNIGSVDERSPGGLGQVE